MYRVGTGRALKSLPRLELMFQKAAGYIEAKQVFLSPASTSLDGIPKHPALHPL